MTVRVGGFTLY